MRGVRQRASAKRRRLRRQRKRRNAKIKARRCWMKSGLRVVCEVEAKKRREKAREKREKKREARRKELEIVSEAVLRIEANNDVLVADAVAADTAVPTVEGTVHSRSPVVTPQELLTSEIVTMSTVASRANEAEKELEVAAPEKEESRREPLHVIIVDGLAGELIGVTVLVARGRKNTRTFAPTAKSTLSTRHPTTSTSAYAAQSPTRVPPTATCTPPSTSYSDVATTVGDLKMLLELQHGIPRAVQVLCPTEQVSPLEDGVRLSECGITGDCAMTLSLCWSQLPGGMGCCQSNSNVAEQAVVEEIEARERGRSDSAIGEVYMNPLRAETNRAGKSRAVANPAFRSMKSSGGGAAAPKIVLTDSALRAAQKAARDATAEGQRLQAKLAAAAAQIKEMKAVKKADIAEKKELAAKLATAAAQIKEMKAAKKADIAVKKELAAKLAAAAASRIEEAKEVHAAELSKKLNAISIAKDAEIAALRSKVPGAAAGSTAIMDTPAPARRAAAAAAQGPDGQLGDHLDDGGDGEHHADLPAALQNFKIIADHPAVAALTAGKGDARRSRLEHAVEAAPADAAAVEELSAYIAELDAATKQAIEEYLKTPGLFKRAFDALEAGNSTFLDVYTAVWNLVEVAEPQSLADYKKRVTAAVAKLPTKKQQQTTASVAALFRDGAVAKPLFDAVVRDTLYARLKRKRKRQVRGAKLQLCPTLKKTTRLAEKAAFALTAAGISDVVRGMLVVKSMAGVDAVLEVLLELEAEGLIMIVRLKDRFCTLPSGGGWRDLMVNFTVVGDATNHICELQVVHEQMLTAREGLPGHAVYDRVRNAVELLAEKFGGKGAAGDALALAGVLVAMGGGGAVGKEGFVPSRGSFDGEGIVEVPHISAKDVFLADKGWLSDAPLSEWMGVRVDERSGRVTHVELKGKGLVGPIPKVLADLTEVEYLDLRTNGKVVRPAGLEPSEAHPTGELGLLDMTGQVHYTTKERCQAFLQHLKKSDADQRMAVAATQLVSKHGPDGPALWTFFNANGKFPGMPKGRWFQQETDDISKWEGVVTEEISGGGGGDDGVAGAGLLRVVGLKLRGFGFEDGFNLEGLDSLPSLASLDLRSCSSLTTLPAELGQLSNLASLDLYDCSSLTTLPAELGQLSNLASLNLWRCSSLTTLPAELGQLSNLASLNLNECSSLAEPFPDVSHLLPTLKVETTYNASVAAKNWVARGLVDRSAFIKDGPAPGTKKVSFAYDNELKVLPEWVATLKHLASLNLAGCSSLTTLPAELGQLSNLASLDLEGCTSLTTLPAELGQLSNLASLNLSGDRLSPMRLTTLPAELGQLSNLASLNLEGCSSLTTLPAELGQLSNLASLSLTNCSSLTTLPAELGQLSNLPSLNLGGCLSLTTLPAELGKLSNLASLDLQWCSSLTTLPAELGQLSNLASLDLYYCSSLAEPFPDVSHLLPTLKVQHAGYASAAASAWAARGCTQK